jgi:hypothetical protein
VEARGKVTEETFYYYCTILRDFLLAYINCTKGFHFEGSRNKPHKCRCTTGLWGKEGVLNDWRWTISYLRRKMKLDYHITSHKTISSWNKRKEKA